MPQNTTTLWTKATKKKLTRTLALSVLSQQHSIHMTAQIQLQNLGTDMESCCCHNNDTRSALEQLRCSEVKYRIKDEKLLLMPAGFTWRLLHVAFKAFVRRGENCPTTGGFKIKLGNSLVLYFAWFGYWLFPVWIVKNRLQRPSKKKTSNRTVGYMKSICSIFNQHVLNDKVYVSKTKIQRRQQQHKVGSTTFNLISFCNNKRECGKIP